MIKGLILAAGRGSRLAELTAEQPKCMVPFLGKPLLEWQIGALSNAGVSPIGLVVGYRADSIPDDLIQIKNEFWDKTNMVSSLQCADEWLGDSEFIVSYSDLVYSPEAVTSLRSATSSIAITYDPRWLDLWKLRFENPLSDAETFRKTPDGFLEDIGRKTTNQNDIQGQYMGLLKFTASGWRAAKGELEKLGSERVGQLDMTSFLRLLISKGYKIEAVPVTSRWYEVDNENDLLLYERLIEQNKNEIFSWSAAFDE